MRVKVRSILDIKKILGGGELEFSVQEEATIKEILEEIKNSWGEELASQLFEPNSPRVLPHIMLMINGRNTELLNRTETVLQDGDELLILPPVGGG